MVRVCPAWRGDLFQIHRSFVVSVNYGGSIRTLGLVGQFIWVFTEAKLVPSESGVRSCCNENSNSSAKISHPLHTLSRHRVIKNRRNFITPGLGLPACSLSSQKSTCSRSRSLSVSDRRAPHSYMVLQRVQACVNLYKGGEHARDF